MSTLDRFSDTRARNGEMPGAANALFLDTCVIVREVLRADLELCGKSREQVAMDLSRLIGREITLAQMEKWVAESAPHRFPAEYMPAWYAATGSWRIFEALAEKAGLWAGTRDDQEFAELGRVRLKDEKLTRKLWGRV